MQHALLMLLILALVEGFIDRGRGAPCAVAGNYLPGAVFAAAVVLLVAVIQGAARGLTE